MDEAEVAKRKYINVLVGSFDTPNDTFLIDCFYLKAVAMLIAILFCTLWMTYKTRKFCIALDRCYSVHVFGWQNINELYPFLMHVTCVAHLLHNCAMRVRAYFRNIDEVVATMKATIKNKDRKNNFHEAGLPLPPDPVITR